MMSFAHTATIWMTLPSSFRLLMVQVCIWPRTLSPSIMNPPPYWSESCRKEIAPSFLMKTWLQAEGAVAHEPFNSNAFAGVPRTIQLDASAEPRASTLDFICLSLQKQLSSPRRLKVVIEQTTGELCATKRLPPFGGGS